MCDCQFAFLWSSEIYMWIEDAVVQKGNHTCVTTSCVASEKNPVTPHIWPSLANINGNQCNALY